MVTIKEIASRANVSIATVDRVIHNRGKVAPDTEEKIKQILKELDYKTNVFARSLKLQKIFKFGILIPDLSQDSNYWENPVKGIKKAQTELSAHKVNVEFFHYNKYSAASFREAVCRALAEDLDGLLIAPVSSHTFYEIIEVIPDNLPYVLFDSNIPNSKSISYIGQDAYQSGILAAKLMSQLISETGCIAVIRVLPADYHIDRRANGFHSYFKEKTEFRTVTYDVDGNGNKKLFKKLLKKIIAENVTLQGIFVTNVCTHKIADQIKDMSLQGKTRLIGYDLIEENIHYLKEGIIDYLISQSPEMQGYQGIYALYRRVVLNERVKARIMMPLDIMTKENIDYYQSFDED